eukprot:jgi/Bigna1/73249/fgenesh1_pg.23_\
MADQGPSRAGRLFVFGRNIHGELGLGKEKRPNTRRKGKAKYELSSKPAKLDVTKQPQQVTGNEGQVIDDELFAMVDENKEASSSSKSKVDEGSLPKSKQSSSFVYSDDAKEDLIESFFKKGAFPVPTEILLAPKEIAHISCGHYHNAVIATKNTVHSWGSDLSGQCGHGRAENMWKPKWVMAISGKSVMDVSCGRTHTLMVASGQVYSWGASSFGALGHSEQNFDQLNPTRIRALRRTAAKQVAAGCEHSLALSNSGEVYAWGRKYCTTNKHFLALFASTGLHVSGKFEHIPRKIPTLSAKVASICAGSHHSMCVMESGLLYSWGCNESGQLGTGDMSPRYSPYQVKFQSPHKSFEKMAVVELSAGARHSSAVIMWFNVMLGEMRTQSFFVQCKEMSPKPLLLSEFNEFSRDEDAKVKRASAVKCGGHHTIVLTESGEAYAFGCGSYGQLGLGDFKHQRSPKKIEALKDVHLASGSCGAWHTVLLTGDKPTMQGSSSRNKWVPFAEPPADASSPSPSAGASSISPDRKRHGWGCARELFLA